MGWITVFGWHFCPLALERNSQESYKETHSFYCSSMAPSPRHFCLADRSKEHNSHSVTLSHLVSFITLTPTGNYTVHSLCHRFHCPFPLLQHTFKQKRELTFLGQLTSVHSTEPRGLREKWQYIFVNRINKTAKYMIQNFLPGSLHYL